jgi:hypothetical protein
MRRALALLLGPLLGPLCGSIAGCGGGATRVCAPNLQVSCPCLGGVIGIQTCNADGTAYSPCQGCPDLRDLAAADLRVPDGGAAGDLRGADLAAAPRDLFGADLTVPDLSGSVGDGSVEMLVPDLELPDLATPDLGPPDLINHGVACFADGATCGRPEACCTYPGVDMGGPYCIAPDACMMPQGVVQQCDGPEDCPVPATPNSGGCCYTFAGLSFYYNTLCVDPCPAIFEASGVAINKAQSQLCHDSTECTGLMGDYNGTTTAFDKCCHSSAAFVPYVCTPAAFLNTPVGLLFSCL